MDQTMSHLRNLEPATAQKAFFMIKTLRHAGLPIIITSSTRTEKEQLALFNAGKSWTLNSYHISGKAFDIDWHQVGRDDVPVKLWIAIGTWAESMLGLQSGMRYQDFGHFENRQYRFGELQDINSV